MNKPRAGFLLSRHWRDTPQGTEITLWLATDEGAQRVVLPLQESVTFIPCEYQAQVDTLLQGERQLQHRQREQREQSSHQRELGGCAAALALPARTPMSHPTLLPLLRSFLTSSSRRVRP